MQLRFNRSGCGAGLVSVRGFCVFVACGGGVRNKRRLSLLLIVFMVFLTVSLSACGGGGGGGGGGGAPVTQPDPPTNPPVVTPPTPGTGVGTTMALTQAQVLTCQNGQDLDTGKESCLTRTFREGRSLTRTKRDNIFLVDNGGNPSQGNQNAYTETLLGVKTDVQTSDQIVSNPAPRLHAHQVTTVADALLPKDSRSPATKGFKGHYITSSTPSSAQFRVVYNNLPTNGAVAIAYGWLFQRNGIGVADVFDSVTKQAMGPYIFAPTGNDGSVMTPDQDAGFTRSGVGIRNQELVAMRSDRVRFIYGLNQAQTARFATNGCKGVEKWCVGFPEGYKVKGRAFRGSSISTSSGALTAFTMIWEHLPASATASDAMSIFDSCAVDIGTDGLDESTGRGRFDLWCAAERTEGYKTVTCQIGEDLNGNQESCLARVFRDHGLTKAQRTKRTGIFIMDNGGLNVSFHDHEDISRQNFYYSSIPNPATKTTHGYQVTQVAKRLLPKDANDGLSGRYRVGNFSTYNIPPLYNALPTDGVVSIATARIFSKHGIQLGDIFNTNTNQPAGPYIFVGTGNSNLNSPDQDDNYMQGGMRNQKYIADTSERVRFIYGLTEDHRGRYRANGCEGVEKWCVGFPYRYKLMNAKDNSEFHGGTSFSSSSGAISAFTMIWEHLPASATASDAMAIFDKCSVDIGAVGLDASTGKGRFDLWCAADETAKEVAKATQSAPAGASGVATRFLSAFYGRQFGGLSLPAQSHGKLAIAPEGESRFFAYNPQGQVAYTPAPPSARAFLPLTGTKQDKTRLGLVSEKTGESGAAISGTHAGIRWQVAATWFSSDGFFGSQGSEGFSFARSENLRFAATVRPAKPVSLTAWQTQASVHGKGSLLRSLTGSERGIQATLGFTTAQDTRFTLSGYAAHFAGGKVCYTGAACSPIDRGKTAYGATGGLYIPFKVKLSKR